MKRVQFTPVIEKEVEMPPKRTPNRAGAHRWHFLTNMQVGDSVFFPANVVKPASVAGGVHRVTKKLNLEGGTTLKFSCRKRQENGVLGTRIWRTK
tara:strand:+ start:449 stop:733 length:285 start_codon:yes stop_codon:yes gene_type:complete